jgi:hypothetical protein
MRDTGLVAQAQPFPGGRNLLLTKARPGGSRVKVKSAYVRDVRLM